MMERALQLWPEITLFVTTCVVMVLGQSRQMEVRKLCGAVSVLGLIIAGLFALRTSTAGDGALPFMMGYAKTIIAIVGILLVMLMAGTIDRELDDDIKAGRRIFDPLSANRAEFYAFILFSLTGAMLCASADTLIWLFLALELTSLPTYIMVTVSTRGTRSQEAGVKYFYLGAFGAALFLYGFTMLYGGTGTTHFDEMQQHFAEHGVGTISLLGLILSAIGIGFKIAAVPMHFYTADVYQGAATPVSTFLGFVPKAAGFLALLTICSTVGWTYGGTIDGMAVPGTSLPDGMRLTLWIMAALTMTTGNVLALLQKSAKRMLAYSSIAHTGYMLVGVIAGPALLAPEGQFAQSGVSAVLFYLLTYGIMNTGAFGVLACLERRDASGNVREVEDIDDLRGLCRTHPLLGSVLVLSSLSLLGLPPVMGFFGKLPLFMAGVTSGEIVLVVILGLNSAIAAWYYLKLVALPMLHDASSDAEQIVAAPFPSRRAAVGLAGLLIIIVTIFADTVLSFSGDAGRVVRPGAIQHDSGHVGIHADADARRDH